MITYIVPSYNQGQFIQFTIESILTNMATEDQLIIADGASTDCTADVVRPFLSDQRIEWYSEPDRGFSEAMTKALTRARHSIIGIMSSDDTYLAGVRARIAILFSDPELFLVYGDYEIIDVDNRKIAEHRHRNGTMDDLLTLRVVLPQSSVFFRKEALEGRDIFNLNFDYIADVVLFNQICQRGKFIYLRELWSQVRQHPASRADKRNPGTQYLQAVKSAFGELSVDQLRRATAGALLLRSRYEASSTQRIKAVKTMIAAILLDPFVLLNHWMFRRALLYILLGQQGVSYIKKILRNQKFSRSNR